MLTNWGLGKSSSTTLNAIISNTQSSDTYYEQNFYKP